MILADDLYWRREMAEAAKIVLKYQVTLPKKVRNDLHVSIGDILVFVKEKGDWKIRAIPNDPLQAHKMAGAGLSSGDFRKIHEEFESGWKDSSRDE